MINAITTALSGLNSATKQVEQSAQSIAESPSTQQLIEDVVDIRVSETAYKANLSVLKVADEMSQELLNSFDETV